METDETVHSRDFGAYVPAYHGMYATLVTGHF